MNYKNEKKLLRNRIKKLRSEISINVYRRQSKSIINKCLDLEEWQYATNVHIYVSAITLSNTGAVLTIYNEEMDGNPGEVIFSVNYGDTGFPNGSGASISLNPVFMNATNAVLGTSWCKSTSSYNTGDLGTPGIANDGCQ